MLTFSWVKIVEAELGSVGVPGENIKKCHRKKIEL